MSRPLIITAVSVVSLVLGLGLYMHLSKPFRVEVPTSSRGMCPVSQGDLRSEVRKRCGVPCGEGVSMRGAKCGPDGSGCKVCDIYGAEAICYVDGAAVDVEHRTAHGCAWY